MGYSFLLDKLVIITSALLGLQGEESEAQHLLKIYHRSGVCLVICITISFCHQSVFLILPIRRHLSQVTEQGSFGL